MIVVTTKSLAGGLFSNRLKKNGRSTRARGASIIATRLKILNALYLCTGCECRLRCLITCTPETRSNRQPSTNARGLNRWKIYDICYTEPPTPKTLFTIYIFSLKHKFVVALVERTGIQNYLLGQQYRLLCISERLFNVAAATTLSSR